MCTYYSVLIQYTIMNRSLLCVRIGIKKTDCLVTTLNLDPKLTCNYSCRPRPIIYTYISYRLVVLWYPTTDTTNKTAPIPLPLIIFLSHNNRTAVLQIMRIIYVLTLILS